MSQIITIKSETVENGNSTCTNTSRIILDNIREKQTGTIVTAPGANAIEWPWLDVPTTIYLEIETATNIQITHAGNVDNLYGAKTVLLEGQYFTKIQFLENGITRHYEVYGT